MYQQIVKFWFEEIQPAQWWKKDDKFDALLVERFSDIHTRASCCELFEWRKQPLGRQSTAEEIEFLGQPGSSF